MKLLQAKIKTSTKTVTSTKIIKAQTKALPPDIYPTLTDERKINVCNVFHLRANIQRGGEYGLPCIDLRTYQTTKAFTGYTRKGINIPAGVLPDLIKTLQELHSECEKKGYYKEYDEGEE